MAVFRLHRITGAAQVRPRSRSWAWRLVSRSHLRKFPTCAACGSARSVVAHHIIPVSVDPTLELNPSNLLTLCESSAINFNCHLYIGHGGNWSAYNPHCRAHAADMLADIGVAVLSAVLASRASPLRSV